MKTIFWPANHFKVNVNDIVIIMDSTEQIRYCDITNKFHHFYGKNRKHKHSNRDTDTR